MQRGGVSGGQFVSVNQKHQEYSYFDLASPQEWFYLKEIMKDLQDLAESLYLVAFFLSQNCRWFKYLKGGNLLNKSWYGQKLNMEKKRSQ